ncbi:MAG: M1 family metallopeptidase, partial [Planctomycetes bacterium]|nr:M1 family metallopeptidase [Planctomycetota bacterium]
MRRFSAAELFLCLLPIAAVACGSTGSRTLDAPTISRRHTPRTEPVDVEHYALDVALDPAARTIAGTCRVSMIAVQSGVAELSLDLEGLSVENVRDRAGNELGFVHDGATLFVMLADALDAGERLELAIEYSGTPRAGLWFVGDGPAPARHVFTQGECEASRAWFPCFDYPADRATSEIRVEMPAEWTSVCAGELVDQGELAGARRFEHWRMATPHPTYLTTLVAGDFVVQTDEWEGVPLLYLAPEVYADFIPASFERTPEVLAFLSDFAGLRFPYAKYSQACVDDFPFGGMENISATTLTCETLTDARGHRDRGSIGLVVHEAAHQWFGDLLTCREWSHIWLNEGFATYCTELWFEAQEGRESFQIRMRDVQDSYTSQDVGANRRPTVHDVYRDPMDLFFGGHTYQGGAARLHLLRGVLGDDAFFAGVRRYVTENQGRGVRTDDLRVALQGFTDRDLGPLFDEWFFSAGFPVFRFDSSWANGELNVVVEQLQEDGGRTPAVFHLPVEVEVRFEDETRVELLELTERRQVFRFDAPTEPRWVRLDPNDWIPKQIEITRPAQVWMDLAANCANPSGRREALQVLSMAIATETDEAARGRMSRVIAAQLANDPIDRVRVAAAKALATGKGSSERGALIDGVKRDASADVRVAALKSLYAFGRDPQLAKFAEETFYAGYSWKVMAAAAGLRASAGPEDAFSWVLGRLETPSPHAVLEADLLDVLSTLEDPRAMPLM